MLWLAAILTQNIVAHKTLVPVTVKIQKIL